MQNEKIMETELGNLYMEKAGKYEDASLWSSTYMEVCCMADKHGGNIQAMLREFREDRLPRWRELAKRPGRPGEFWQEKIDAMETALKELEEMWMELRRKYGNLGKP